MEYPRLDGAVFNECLVLVSALLTWRFSTSSCFLSRLISTALFDYLCVNAILRLLFTWAEHTSGKRELVFYEWPNGRFQGLRYQPPTARQHDVQSFSETAKGEWFTRNIYRMFLCPQSWLDSVLVRLLTILPDRIARIRTLVWEFVEEVEDTDEANDEMEPDGALDSDDDGTLVDDEESSNDPSSSDSDGDSILMMRSRIFHERRRLPLANSS